MAELTDTDIREQVRERYAAAATAVATKTSSGCCGSATGEAGCGPAGAEVFGGGLYDEEGDAAPKAAVEASLGCGVPTAVADLMDVPAVVSGHAPDLVPIIERHQARTRRAHVAIEGSTLRRRGYRIRAWFARHEYRLMRSGRVSESYLAAAAFLLLAVPYRLVRGKRPDGRPWRRQRETDNKCNP